MQRRETLEGLARDGAIRNGGAIVDEDFAGAYGWMTGRMRERVGMPPEGISYPVWVWIRYHGRPFRPGRCPDDLDGMVLVEAEIPDGMVLASDFDEWHCVLNGFPHDSHKEAEEAWDRWIKQREDPDGPMPEDVRRLMEQSWEGIFHSDGDSVQGTVWEIRQEWIVSIRPLRQTMLRKIRRSFRLQ